MDSSPRRLSDAELLECVIAAQSDSTGESQPEAWRDLEAELKALGKSVSLRFQGRVKEELAETAIDKIYDVLRRGMFDPDRGPFRSWARRVLENHGISLEREYSRVTEQAQVSHLAEQGGSDPLAELQDPMAQQTEHGIETQANKMRQALDILRDGNLATAKTDYYAVFLLCVRQAVATRLARSCPGDEQMEALLPDLALWVERLVSWHDDEYELRCQPSWPTIATIWDSAAKHLNEPPHSCSGELLCEIVSIQIVGGPPLGISNWYWLVKRAKDQARRQLSDELWEELFGSLFVTRNSHASDPGA